MRLLPDASEGDWLTARVMDTQATDVASTFPTAFPAYAKIFHPIYEDLSVTDQALTWQQENLYRFWFLATVACENNQVFEGTLDEATLFPGKALGVWTTPNHWYPDDRSWMVRTDYDDTFSLVGGSEALIQDVLGHPGVEAVRVTPETRLGWKACPDTG